MTLIELHRPGSPVRRPRGPRIALYSHDTQGLGHIRRNLAIASALSGMQPRPDVLLVSGIRDARSFALPPGADLLTLPALAKDANGAYEPRSLSTSLESLLALRAATICAALEAFSPDVLIVDKVARGALGELDPALRALRRAGTTAIVLGLRDVLDAPAATRADMARDGTLDAIREQYDAVWVYGDPAVFDPVREYGLPDDVAAKVVHTGYLARGRPVSVVDAEVVGDRPYALCLVGGGQDGASLAESFLETRLPDGLHGLLVTGPFLPERTRQRLAATAAASDGRCRVVDFLPDISPLVQGAERVIAMGGYNTVCELLAAGSHPLVVPRTTPRAEQMVRARRMAALGLLDVCHPESLGPGVLAEWLARPLPPQGRRRRIDLDGLARLPGLVDQLVAAQTAPAPAHEVRARVAV